MSGLSTEPETLTRLSARAQAWADLFRLPLQHRVWRGQTGDFQGAGVGSSLDFQDHRNYVPGDDPRHINWQAYARTGNYSMKLYREEVRPMVDLVFEVSDSLFFEPDKATRSLELFYFAQYAAMRSGASVKAHVVKGEANLSLTESMIHSHAWAREAASLPATASAEPPALHHLPFRPQSLRILVSDLLFEGAPERQLMPMSRGNGRGLILAPYLQSEASPPWEGNCELVDAETQRPHERRVDPSLRKRYREAYTRHFALWSRECRRFDILTARVPAELAFPAALQAEALASGALELAS